MLAHPLLLLLHKLAWQIDIVVPVPMTTPHRSKRGYNQAALLAWPVALGSHHKYCPEALVKIRFSRSQVGLTHEERYQNVAGAFLANPRLVAGRSILVVDDVMTSGATMQACAATLIEAGAASVFGLTLARAGTVADHNSTGWLDPQRQAAAEPG
jgi:ComF family protein